MYGRKEQILFPYLKMDFLPIAAPLSHPHLSPSPSTLASYLALSFLICACLNQHPFSAAETAQPPIVLFCFFKRHRLSLGVCAWSCFQSRRSGFEAAVWLPYFVLDLSFVVFCGMSLSCKRLYQLCHTHYKHCNLLINQLWLVSDGRAMDRQTLSFNESSFLHCIVSHLRYIANDKSHVVMYELVLYCTSRCIVFQNWLVIWGFIPGG